MGLLEIILIAFGVAMDVFAVSITLGLSTKKLKPTTIIIPGVYFGFFQSLMPVLGYFVGIYFINKIENVDHWIALVLLGVIGGKMIKDSFAKDNSEESVDKNSFCFVKMLILAVATSIDALAIGITFAFFKVNIYTAALIIGLITLVIAMSGVVIGNIFGTKFSSKAEFIGGAVLIIIGIKIVIEHLFW
ncbi:MAG: manganese efflux pump MntP family protein [Deltaproteobacteria bacterium]|jgi:putative Mn2+ efflux pump MntP|nr:manganese efflux pump MntP family protein [Deltaproteobacteria bacterium]